MVERTSQRKRQSGGWGMEEGQHTHMVHTNEQGTLTCC